MSRWAICDAVSLSSAKAGLSPGWAYRVDAAHFTRSGGWMEAWGREFKPASCVCMVLEGIVRDDIPMKSEIKEEEKPAFTQAQYHALITAVYQEKNPAKLADVDDLLLKFENREVELLQRVCEKYQADVEELKASLPEAFEPAGAKDELDEYTLDENADVPNLEPAEYAMCIQSVYEQFNAKKLQDIGRLLLKYRNRERELYHDVCRKYGVNPAVFYAKRQQGKEA
eukprot:NODE_19902_length_822_cov_7.847482.p1 GENE.NODE_19902_length_822_cov_7.847482~~NODE_19902_length_822_cov_7.847482.p1  ORF type:complete len:226 (+),score=82.79 NODE_19902_length_822_cov_7.847482:27-704(+)